MTFAVGDHERSTTTHIQLVDETDGRQAIVAEYVRAVLSSSQVFRTTGLLDAMRYAKLLRASWTQGRGTC
jgi:hypothetical protein